MDSTWIELDLTVLENNIQRLRSALAPGKQVIFVVKANAYGHGVVPVARSAWQAGIRWFAVVNLEEGLELRGAVPQARVLILGRTEPTEVPAMLDHGFIPLVVGESHGTSLAQASAARGAVLPCHIHIDTGMGRLGFAWQEAARLLPRVASLPGLDVGGMCTHFASSDAADRSFTDVQFTRFQQVLRQCMDQGLDIPFTHVANTAGALREAAWDMDAVRVGLLLYGYGTGSGAEGWDRRVQTEPILRWNATVVQVKHVPAGFPVSYGGTYVTESPTHVGTVSVGYADGYARRLSNRSFVLVGGQRRPVIGRVTMNFICVDLGADTDVKEGDEVVLLGRQGRETIWADEVADWADTIPYEVLTSIRTNDRRLAGVTDR